MPFFSKIKNLFVRALLWCEPTEERRLEIGYPTDFRRGDFTIDGLSEDQQAIIREKAIADASFPLTPPPLHSPSRSSVLLFPESFCESPRKVPPLPVRLSRSVSSPLPFECPRNVPPFPVRMSRSNSSPALITTVRQNAAASNRQTYQTVFPDGSLKFLPESRLPSVSPLAVRPESSYANRRVEHHSMSSEGFVRISSTPQLPPLSSAPIRLESSVSEWPPLAPTGHRRSVTTSHCQLPSPNAIVRLRAISLSQPRSQTNISTNLPPTLPYQPIIPFTPVSSSSPKSLPGLPNSTRDWFIYPSIHDSILEEADHGHDPVTVTEPRDWEKHVRIQSFEEQLIKSGFPYAKSTWSTGSCSSFHSSNCSDDEVDDEDESGDEDEDLTEESGEFVSEKGGFVSTRAKEFVCV